MPLRPSTWSYLSRKNEKVMRSTKEQGRNPLCLLALDLTVGTGHVMSWIRVHATPPPSAPVNFDRRLIPSPISADSMHPLPLHQHPILTWCLCLQLQPIGRMGS